MRSKTSTSAIHILGRSIASNNTASSGKTRSRRLSDYHLFWPDRPYREDHSILIAGCGTSQAAKHALRWPKAQVTGIDLSATSVRCTEELKRKYNLNNLQVHQLPSNRSINWR